MTKHSVSAAFTWTTGRGTFTGVTFSGPGYETVNVIVERDGKPYPFARVELNPQGNTIVEFDEWRMRETGYVPDLATVYPAWSKAHPGIRVKVDVVAPGKALVTGKGVAGPIGFAGHVGREGSRHRVELTESDTLTLTDPNGYVAHRGGSHRAYDRAARLLANAHDPYAPVFVAIHFEPKHELVSGADSYHTSGY